MNSTNYLTPTVQIASPCYLIKKKKKKKERNTKYIYIYISKTAERAMKQQKYFFHRMKKRKKKKKYPLWKCPSTWHHRHIAIFFSRFTAPLFAFYRATLLPTLTYMCLVVANEICARKKTRVWERETWLDEQRKKNWNRKFSSRKTTSIPRKGIYSFPLRKNIPNIPELWPIIISKVLEQRRDRGGVVGGLEGEGKHVSLVNDNDEHRCKPDDNA